MNCPSCGKSIPDNSTFCPECGAQAQQQAAPPPPAPPVTPPPVAPATPPVAPPAVAPATPVAPPASVPATPPPATPPAQPPAAQPPTMTPPPAGAAPPQKKSKAGCWIACCGTVFVVAIIGAIVAFFLIRAGLKNPMVAASVSAGKLITFQTTGDGDSIDPLIHPDLKAEQGLSGADFLPGEGVSSTYEIINMQQPSDAEIVFTISEMETDNASGQVTNYIWLYTFTEYDGKWLLRDFNIQDSDDGSGGEMEMPMDSM